MEMRMSPGLPAVPRRREPEEPPSPSSALQSTADWAALIRLKEARLKVTEEDLFQNFGGDFRHDFPRRNAISMPSLNDSRCDDTFGGFDGAGEEDDLLDNHLPHGFRGRHGSVREAPAGGRTDTGVAGDAAGGAGHAGVEDTEDDPLVQEPSCRNWRAHSGLVPSFGKSVTCDALWDESALPNEITDRSLSLPEQNGGALPEQNGGDHEDVVLDRDVRDDERASLSPATSTQPSTSSGRRVRPASARPTGLVRPDHVVTAVRQPAFSGSMQGFFFSGSRSMPKASMPRDLHRGRPKARLS